MQFFLPGTSQALPARPSFKGVRWRHREAFGREAVTVVGSGLL